MVGAVLVKRGEIIGEGWHRAAGQPHAEIEALRDAERHGHSPKGATLYVTLEPCCTHGHTPPCTDALIQAGVRRVVVAATDPNPAHAGHGFEILRAAGIQVVTGVLAEESSRMNAAFNHWIVHRTPFVTLKAAMTLDGKIATANGESKWITGEKSRSLVQKLRLASDAVLVGVNTVLADDPSLLPRNVRSPKPEVQSPMVRRVILDTRARTPLAAKVVTDAHASQTLVVVGISAPVRRVAALRKRTQVLVARERDGRVDLRWLMPELGRLPLTSLLVEGGGEVHAAFLEARLAHRVAFFYAPKILGGRAAKKAVAGDGFANLAEAPALTDLRWRRLGSDLLLTARLKGSAVGA
jgi:diaminohydroxyphosphoribosylaminopyrimidine deaminase/5-amino-6-(5-phosphoribosylamino)uracil reductase